MSAWSDDDLSLGSSNDGISLEENGDVRSLVNESKLNKQEQQSRNHAEKDNIIEGEGTNNDLSFDDEESYQSNGKGNKDISITTDDSDNDIEYDTDDYIPDSLKDVFVEADATLEMMAGSEIKSSSVVANGFDSLVRTPEMNLSMNIEHIEGEMETEGLHVKSNQYSPKEEDQNQQQAYSDNQTRTPSIMNDYQSPPSDIRGPYDTDLGSNCRPNPALFYNTESAVKHVALNEDHPYLCPAHRGECDCGGYTVFKNRYNNKNGGGAKDSTDVAKENKVQNKTVVKLDDFLKAAEGEGNSNMDVHDGDMSMKEEELGDEGFLPNLQQSVNRVIVDDDQQVQDFGLQDEMQQEEQELHFVQDVDCSVGEEEDEYDEFSFLPNNSTKLQDMTELPHCYTMKHSNVSTRRRNKNTSKFKSTSLMTTVKKITNTKRTSGSSTIYGSNKKATSSITATSNLDGTTTTNNAHRTSGNATIPRTRHPKDVGSMWTATIPKSPPLITKKLHGERRYSVGSRVEKNNNNINKSVSSIFSFHAEKNEVETEPIKQVDYKKKALTIPKGPKLRVSEKLGKRTYSTVGVSKSLHHQSNHSHTDSDRSNGGEPAKIDYKTKKLTVPKAPKLKSSEKLGERKYSVAGKRNEQLKENTALLNAATRTKKIDYKKKLLTVPSSPKLMSTQKLGERRYSSTVGPREDKMNTTDVPAVTSRNIDWKNRKPTIPTSPRLSIAIRPQQHKKVSTVKADHKEEEKFVFKALPIKPGVLDPKPVSVRRIMKVTVPMPFNLKTEERIPERSNKMKKESESRNAHSDATTTFRARPLPDFSCNPSLPQPPQKKLTTPKPFNLKTARLTSSPRQGRTANVPDAVKGAGRTANVPGTVKGATTTGVRSSSGCTILTKAHYPDRVKGKKPITTPKPFTLLCDQRLRSTTKRVPKQNNVPIDLAKFLSPTKKRKVTVQKPFRLSLSRLSKSKALPSSPPKMKHGYWKPRTRRPASPPHPPSKLSPSKLKPFNLSRSNFKVKSSTKQDCSRDARGLPFRLHKERSKEDCPIEFRRKLLLKKKLVNQLDELSVLVQQTVI